MAHFLRLGSHRLPCWSLLLIPFVCFSEWKTSDSAVLVDIKYLSESIWLQNRDANTSLNYIASSLYEINSDVDEISSHISDIDSDVDDIAYDVTGIKSTLSQIRTIQGQLSDTLNLINAKLVVSAQSSITTNDGVSAESLYVHDVRNDDIYNRLGSLQDSIDNLTNYLCYSPTYVSVFTNRYSQIFPQSYSVSTMDNSVISQFFKFYYGYTPSTQLVSDFKNTVGRLATYDLASSMVTLVPSSALTGSPGTTLSWYNNLRGQLSVIGVNVNTRSAIDAIGNARYFAYGTRDLTRTVMGISNDMARLEAGGYFERDTSPESHGYRVSEVVRQGVSSVMDDSYFTETASTNVEGSVWSNSIARLADNDYKNQLERLRDSDPQYFTDLSDVLSELAVAQGAVDDSINHFYDADHSDDYVIPLQYTDSHLGNVDLSLKITNVTSYTRPVVDFICYFLKLAIGLYFFRVAWAKVVATVNFQNQPDPF